MGLKRIFCLLTVIGCTFTSTISISPVRAQSTLQLPSALIFNTFPTEYNVTRAGQKVFIEEVDQQTQQISPFYVNPFGHAFAMVWSPTGKFLAVVLEGHLDTNSKIGSSDGPNDGEGHICILNRAGQLQRCMKKIVYNGLGASGKGDGLYSNYIPSFINSMI